MLAAFANTLGPVNILMVFLVIPLTMNETLPIVFAYTILTYYGKWSRGLAFLTLIAYLLSSIAFWILYSRLIPAVSNSSDGNLEYGAYLHYMLELSGIPACGGYSALAACTDSLLGGIGKVRSATSRILVATPLIWAFSTLILLFLFARQLWTWKIGRKESNRLSEPKAEATRELVVAENPFHRGTVFWVVTLIFFLGLGLQLALFNISLDLNMTNQRDWGFGQVVAVTIWFPALIEYLYAIASKSFVSNIQ
jgi:hypothetical protein